MGNPGINILKNSLEISTKQKHPNFNRDQVRAEVRKKVKQFKVNRKNPIYRASVDRDFMNAVEKDFGILSLSSISNDILMWSHYSDMHRGFCVGFDSRKLLNVVNARIKAGVYAQVLPVQYREEYPLLRISAEKEKIDVLNDLLTIKARNWKYESEYRLILNGETNRSLSLPRNTIRTVILGAKMVKVDREEIVASLSQNHMEVDLFQAKLQTDKFGLEFVKIGYK